MSADPKKEVLFILQALDLCNLNCKYCYLPGRQDKEMMSDDILSLTIQKMFEWKNTQKGPIYINWNAGEPLTAPVSFYEKAASLIEKYNKNEVPVDQSIQTNGVLLNDKWCRTLNQLKITTTISVDGPEFIHDRFRVNWKGRGSHKLVQKGIHTLKKYQDHLSGICVLTDYSLDYPDEIFFYFLDNGFSRVGFNIEEQEIHNSKTSFMENNKTITETVSRYYKFLSRIFHLANQYEDKIRVREFATTKSKLSYLYTDSEGQTLNTQSAPLEIIVVAKNGNLYTFSPELTGGTKKNPDEFVLGNISEIDSFSDILKHPKFLKMHKEIQDGIQLCANTCEYFSVCGGGVPVNKFSENGTFASSETNYCKLSQQTPTEVFLDMFANTTKKEVVLT